MSELGKVVKVEFKYEKKADPNYKGESFGYTQELIIEGANLKTIDRISDGSVIKKEYEMAGENFCDLITDIGIGEKPVEGVNFINYDPSYILKIIYENGEKSFSGAYTEYDTPENWKIVLLALFDYFSFHNYGLMFAYDSKSFKETVGNIRYLEVLIEGEKVPEFYKTFDTTISNNDRVKIRKGDSIVNGIVTDIRKYTIGRAPYNFKKSKFIICKV